MVLRENIMPARSYGIAILTGALVLAAECALPQAAFGDALAIADPLPPGPYAVGCSNVEQDFSRVGANETAKDYWEGFPDASGRPRYVTDLLADPADALVLTVTPPDDPELYVNHAGEPVSVALLVCYPTASDNPRPDYPLPGGLSVPHMQRGTDAPIWPDATTRWPVLEFSHGLSGSPLSNDYIVAIAELASYGYVVIAPFHGDPRFADVTLQNFSDIVYALLHIPTFVEMQAIRPLSMVAALDFLLAHPDYRDRVDPGRIAGFGASIGGETMLLLGGAQLTTTIGQSSKQVIVDPRLKAIVGYVPYFGQLFYPAFGRDWNGLDSMRLPFLGISGTADTTAPLAAAVAGFGHLSNSRDLVALVGVGHEFDYPSAPDIFTWTLTFVAAHALDDRLARARIARMTSVRGGGDDVLLIDYTAPGALDPGERDTIEYYNAALGHYFLTAEPAEAAMLDAGVIVPGWTRTGFAFKSWIVGAGDGLPACRFFGTPGVGPNSHFYTIDPTECALVRANPAWTFEGYAFAEEPPLGGDCAADRVPVVRLYNNGMGGQASHRFLTSKSEMAAMLVGGWLIEGTVFCAAP
jgi:predicted dienelactone hydrolase